MAKVTSSRRQVVFPPIENLQMFKQCLRMTLSKLSDTHTVKTAQDELQELMTEHITNTDRMNSFWQALAVESSHHDTKMAHKKEIIKVYGKAAEVFEEALVPFL
jgi:hypothetical protein